MKSQVCISLLFILLFTQCNWFRDAFTPTEQLPPATQVGANTFGCLLNGKVWLPKGNNSTSNYSVSYDPNYAKGSLVIRVYRYLSDDPNSEQYFAIGLDSLMSTGIYTIAKPSHMGVIFFDDKSNCKYLQGGTYYRQGQMTITKFDLKSGIISGTFEFTIAKPGCDTMKVTQGRFDKKL